jgi:hypothetical protein
MIEHNREPISRSRVYDVYPRLDARDAATVKRLYDARDLDFRLRRGSAAVDRGTSSRSALVGIEPGSSQRVARRRCLLVESPQVRRDFFEQRSQLAPLAIGQACGRVGVHR